MRTTYFVLVDCLTVKIQKIDDSGMQQQWRETTSTHRISHSPFSLLKMLFGMWTVKSEQGRHIIVHTVRRILLTAWYDVCVCAITSNDLSGKNQN